MKRKIEIKSEKLYGKKNTNKLISDCVESNMNRKTRRDKRHAKVLVESQEALNQMILNTEDIDYEEKVDGLYEGNNRTMGILGLLTRNKNSEYKSNNYSNGNAVANLVRYITRTREYETRADSLVAYGAAGCGYFLSSEDIIKQLCYIQQTYNINSRKGRRMYHEVFNFDDREIVQLNYDSEQL